MDPFGTTAKWMAAMALAAGFAAAGPAVADELKAQPRGDAGVPAAPADAAQIARWVEQLGNEDFELRQQAMERLTAAGPAAIDALSAATGSQSAEIAWRAGEVLERIGVSGDEQTVDQVCRAMEKLSGRSDRFSRVAKELRTRWREFRHADAADRLRRLGAELHDYPSEDAFGYASPFGPVFISPTLPLVEPVFEAGTADVYVAPTIDLEEAVEVPASDAERVRVLKAEAAASTPRLAAPPAPPRPADPPPPRLLPLEKTNADPFAVPAETKREGSEKDGGTPTVDAARPAAAEGRAVEPHGKPRREAAPEVEEDVFGAAPEPADLKPLLESIPEEERPAEPAAPLPLDDLPGTAEKAPSTLDAADSGEVLGDVDIRLDDAVAVYDPYVISSTELYGAGLYGPGLGGPLETPQPQRTLKLGPAFKGGDADLEALRDLQGVASLEIERRRVTDAALDQIAAMQDLRLLTLQHSRYDRKSVLRFKQRRPEVAVQAFGDAILGISGEPSSGGFLVSLVVDGSGAGKAGLREGDVIRRIDGELIPNFDLLSLVITSHRVGDRVAVELLRNGKIETLEATLGKRD